jgi:hypothetical protein
LLPAQCARLQTRRQKKYDQLDARFHSYGCPLNRRYRTPDFPPRGASHNRIKFIDSTKAFEEIRGKVHHIIRCLGLRRLPG